ncbi:hypothetical protein An14g03830 [Aspergillus niger]|uniref:Uncharacterized protein n=2 Tax=Aspergillus niger TaxID=5061 RepID=A2R3C8_ASPNC|nr:hypothetical protein An14g03830 [Aspergillus niger]CAK46620.1 hypothetical protein An14g03830 [Aspergillus niger]
MCMSYLLGLNCTTTTTTYYLFAYLFPASYKVPYPSRSRYHQFGRVQDTHLEAKVPTPRLSSKCEVDRFHPIPRVQSIVESAGDDDGDDQGDEGLSMQAICPQRGLPVRIIPHCREKALSK